MLLQFTIFAGLAGIAMCLGAIVAIAFWRP